MSNLEEYAKKKQQEDFFVEQEEEEELFRDDTITENYYETEEDLYYKQQTRGVGDESGWQEPAVSYVRESVQQKLNQTTFAERTEYYFEDPKYMEAKRERYKSLGSKKNHELDEYAKKHTNRSASKRKDKANDAAKCFEKARKLEEKFAEKHDMRKDDQKNLLATYRAREEIMRVRLEGMIYAAKAKSTSDKNEEYRIAKAQLSCLSVLLDQANMLENKKEAAEFAKIEKGLKKEIAQAEKKLAKYAPDVNEKWQDSLGLNDKKYVKEKLAEAKKRAPYVNEEDLKLQLTIKSMITTDTPEFTETIKKANENHAFANDVNDRGDELFAAMNYVRKDKYGLPINKEELKKEEWNKKWLEVCVDPARNLERKKMLIETYQRYERIEIPSPEEIKKKGMKQIFMENPTALMELVRINVTIDNIKPSEPFVHDYYYSNPVFRAKCEAGQALANMFHLYISENHGIKENEYYNFSSYEFFEKLPEQDKEAKKDYERSMKDYTDQYVYAYKSLLEKNGEVKKDKQDDALNMRTLSTLSYAQWQKDPVNTSKDREKFFAGGEESYKVYRAFKDSNMVMKNPYYREAYNRTLKKLGNGQDRSRILGFMLRECNFDRNWVPVTQKDMDAHIWNLKVLNNVDSMVAGREMAASEKTLIDNGVGNTYVEDKKKLADESRERLLEMAKEEMDKTYGNMTDFPSYETIEKEFILPLKNGEELNAPSMEKYLADVGGYAQLSQHLLSQEGIFKILPEAEDYMKEHPEYEQRAKTFRILGIYIDAYCIYKHHVLPETGGVKSRIEANAYDVNTLEAFKAPYEEEYSKLK